MTKLFAGLLGTFLAVAVGFVPALTHAQEDASGKTEAGAKPSADSTKEETFIEKLEDTFKETTTPTDAETDPIGTAEDADRDLY